MSAMADSSRTSLDWKPSKTSELFSVNYKLAILCNENNVLISQHWFNTDNKNGWFFSCWPKGIPVREEYGYNIFC